MQTITADTRVKNTISHYRGSPGVCGNDKAENLASVLQKPPFPLTGTAVLVE
jgi:hypothetical protein